MTTSYVTVSLDDGVTGSHQQGIDLNILRAEETGQSTDESNSQNSFKILLKMILISSNRPESLNTAAVLHDSVYLRLQLRQVCHHFSASQHQVFQMVLQTLQLLTCLRLLTAPLPQISQTAWLEVRIQFHVERPLVENPMNLHLTVPWELMEKNNMQL